MWIIVGKYLSNIYDNLGKSDSFVLFKVLKEIKQKKKLYLKNIFARKQMKMRNRLKRYRKREREREREREKKQLNMQ